MISTEKLCGALIAAAAFVLMLTASGTSRGEDFEAHPLRPLDTSSPRDTLRSFLESTDRSWAELRKESYAEGLRSRGRALQALDFSETPHGREWEEQSRRLIYLKEILDRISLPPFDQIPGDAEVAEGTLRKWTIPDTTISIARVEEGERSGEWLFAAGSVARVHRYYRQVAHLPYKQGASGGFLENYLRVVGGRGNAGGFWKRGQGDFEDTIPTQADRRIEPSRAAAAVPRERERCVRADPGSRGRLSLSATANDPCGRRRVGSQGQHPDGSRRSHPRPLRGTGCPARRRRHRDRDAAEGGLRPDAAAADRVGSRRPRRRAPARGGQGADPLAFPEHGDRDHRAGRRPVRRGVPVQRPDGCTRRRVLREGPRPAVPGRGKSQQARVPSTTRPKPPTACTTTTFRRRAGSFPAPPGSVHS